MRPAFLLLLVPAAAFGEEGRVSSGFGVRDDPIHHRRAAHRGVDLPGRPGTPIVAAASGIVRRAGRRGGYGELVELAHPDGTVTRYAHLSRILVRPGDPVDQGQLIGEMGSTGRSTGSHLHFEYRIGGVAVDPLRYVGRPAASVPGRRAAGETPPHRSRFARMRVETAPRDPATLPDASDVVRSGPDRR